MDGSQTGNSVARSGAAYVFTRTGGTTWKQRSYIKASNTGAEDYFGWSVALSSDGDTLAAGAHGEDSAATGINGDQTDNAQPISGAVYVY